MTRTARVAVNGITNGGRFVVSLVVFFFLTPFIIERLGPDDFGLWTLVFSVVGFLGLLDLGFSTGVVKYVAECKGAGDVTRRNQLLSTFALVYVILAALAAVGVIALSSVFGSIFELPVDQHSKALTLLWIVAARAVVLNLPLSLFRGILFGEQKIYLLNLVQAVTTVLYGLSVWLLLDQGYGLLALGWMNLVAMLVEHGAYVLLAYRSMDNLRLAWSLVRLDLLKEVFSFSFFSFIVSVGALILLRTDPIIVKLYLPLSAVAVYAIALKIAEYGHLLTKQFINVMSPLVAELNQSGDGDKIHFLLVNGSKFALVPGVVMTVGAFCLGQEAILFWVGEDFAGAWPVLCILMTAMSLAIPQLVASNILTMTGQHKFVAGASTAGTVLNIVLSLVLVRPFGLAGVAMGTLVTTIVIDFAVILPRACRRHGITWSSYLRRVMPAALVPGVIQLALTWMLKEWRNPDNLGDVVLIAIPGIAAYGIAFWLFSLERAEKRLLETHLRPFVRSLRDRLVNRGVKNNLRRGESPPSETLTYETNFSRTVGSLRQPLHETVHKQTSLKTRGTP